MNGKSIRMKQYPHCSDCGYPLLPRPMEDRDGCLLKPLYCAYCDAEKDVIIVEVVRRKPDDRFASAGGAK